MEYEKVKKKIILAHTVQINEEILEYITLGFIYIPVILYMITFVKNWAAIPTIIILLLVFAGIIRDDRKEKQNVEQVVSVNLLMIVLCAACLIVIGFLAGWGGYFPQRGDWLKHNAVMHDLVERPWPVYYYNGEVKSYLSYYIGGYLVPAAIGKLFRSFEVAELAQLIYNNITLFLVWLNIVCYLRIRKIRYGFCTVGMMTFFSGGLMLAQATVRILYPDLLMLGNTHWFSGPSFALQYRDFLKNLQWVFPQYIFPTLIFIAWKRKTYDTKRYVFYLMPMLLYASFSFLAVVLMGLATAGGMLITKRIHISQVLSWENILMALTLGSILFFYLWGNISGKKPESISLKTINYGKYIGAYFIFCLFMFGIYAIIIFKEYIHDTVFWSSVLILTLLPFFSMGKYNDLCMCTSTLPMFYIMICSLEFIIQDKRLKNEAEKHSVKKSVIITLLLISSIYPLQDLAETVTANTSGKNTNDGWKTLEVFADPSENNTAGDDVKYNYYTYNIDNDIFYNCLAK